MQFQNDTLIGYCRHEWVNGKSFHPTHIFKSIVFSEAVRLRRLNETQSDYLASLERLKQKCIHSQFNISLQNF